MKKLSVVTIAKNEEANIASCINSTKDWAEEHIIVDDFSSETEFLQTRIGGFG